MVNLNGSGLTPFVVHWDINHYIPCFFYSFIVLYILGAVPYLVRYMSAVQKPNLDQATNSSPLGYGTTLLPGQPASTLAPLHPFPLSNQNFPLNRQLISSLPSD